MQIGYFCMKWQAITTSVPPPLVHVPIRPETHLPPLVVTNQSSPITCTPPGANQTPSHDPLANGHLPCQTDIPTLPPPVYLDNWWSNYNGNSLKLSWLFPAPMLTMSCIK